MSADPKTRPADPMEAAIAALRRSISAQNAALRPPASEDPEADKRKLEALLFAAETPLDEASLAQRLCAGADVRALLEELAEDYAGRGVTLVRAGDRWRFQTAPDLAHLLEERREAPRKLTPAALETLSIIAYHQPVTRAEIEQIRGVAAAKGTLDTLLEIGWIRMRGRRRSPGRPVTFATTPAFQEHFGLADIGDLPGLADLKAAGLLSGRLPPGFDVPDPGRGEGAAEDPLDEAEAAQFHMDFLETDEDDPSPPTA